jgi:hypothetical protein
MFAAAVAAADEVDFGDSFVPSWFAGNACCCSTGEAATEVEQSSWTTLDDAAVALAFGKCPHRWHTVPLRNAAVQCPR